MSNIKVLDHGFVKLVSHLGSDHTVSQAARMSFGKSTEKLTKADEELIKGLASKGHETPFRHCHVVFHIKMPIMIARQLMRHNVGITWSEKSLRYTNAKDIDHYIPSAERLAGMGDPELGRLLIRCISDGDRSVYQTLLDEGMPKELARIAIPVNAYTELFMTASLQAVAHLVALRDDKHAQWETQEYARAIRLITEELFPVSMKALMEAKWR